MTECKTEDMDHGPRLFPLLTFLTSLLTLLGPSQGAVGAGATFSPLGPLTATSWIKGKGKIGIIAF